MTGNSIFRTIYLVGFVSMFVMRLSYRLRGRDTRAAVTRAGSLEMFLLALAFVGMAATPLVYVSSDVLDFADYQLPVWTGWVGTLVFLAAIGLLWRSHRDLGRNWSQTLELREGHELVTKGVYRRIRHPMYAAFWLWGLAQPLLLHNWLAAFSHLASFAALYFLRVGREERLMLDHFGARYEAYMSRTGRVLPRWARLS
ncbi:MAG TPA: protein-S-isoprenylcysteine O-methyltransferase [Pyrinomonadaceae bacterium]|nr:protein-S-isoprenylcysteine O-methyltransferase [Pyrinomonadaceae bacterium]